MIYSQELRLSQVKQNRNSIQDTLDEMLSRFKNIHGSSPYIIYQQSKVKSLTLQWSIEKVYHICG